MKEFRRDTRVTTQAKENPKIDVSRLFLLAIGRAITDSYGLFPQIAQRLNLSLTQVGALPMMMGLSSSLSQPIFGPTTPVVHGGFGALARGILYRLHRLGVVARPNSPEFGYGIVILHTGGTYLNYDYLSIR